MRLTLIRHATLRVEIGGGTLLVDPMLDPVGARAPVRGTPEPRPNPLVALPCTPEEAVAGINATIVTHLHEDHLDAAGVTALPRGLPLLCQPEDLPEIQPLGFPSIFPLAPEMEMGPLRLARTRGRHAHDEALAKNLGAVSGIVIRAEGEPTLYIAGDTVWCPEVAAAIDEHAPDVIVVNAGAARFVEGGLITMGDEDIGAVLDAAPDARVVAVHLEAINHCLQTRAELAAALGDRADRVAIPADGETLEFG